VILLCSNGLSSQNLINQVSKHMDECKTAALVVTADNMYKERNYHVSRCIQELRQLGLLTTIFDIDTNDPQQLLHYDVVEFIGGNPFYLLQSIRRNHAERIIQQIANERILIGWSAAAFTFSPSLELANAYTPELNAGYIQEMHGLNLVPVHILPHYSKYLTKFDQFEERCRAYEIKNNTTVVRLNDGDGIIFHNSNQTLIRA